MLRTSIAAGLAGLVAIGRPNTPAADMICANADMWLHLLSKRSLVECLEDADRIQRAFSGLAQQSMTEWPEPAAIIPHLPGRTEKIKLTEPPISDADRAANAARMAEWKRRQEEA